MSTWTPPPTCSYTRLYLGVTDDNGISKYAVPLTTVFTPPPGCRFPLEESATTKCWPPSSFRVWAGGGFYSPGLCPSDYTLGCTAGESTGILNGVAVKGDETAGICVPSDFTCYTDDPASILYAMSPIAVGTAIASMYTVPAFQIRWQSSDLPCLETTPIPGIYTPSTRTAASPETSGSAPATSGSGPAGGEGGGGGGNSLSPGAVAGVALGALIGSLIICFGVFCLVVRRSKSQSRPPERYTDGGDDAPQLYEGKGGTTLVGANELHGGDAVRFGDGNGRKKLGGQSVSAGVELSGSGTRERVETTRELSTETATHPLELAAPETMCELPGPEERSRPIASLSTPTVKRKSLPASSPLLQMAGGNSSGP